MTDNLPVVHSVGFSFNELQRIAESMARSQLFGIQTPDQALSLMLISQAEGRHPALAARDYDVIKGRPTKKAEAMQRDFMTAGGKIKWHKLTDDGGSATFSHPIGGEFTADWDVERAKKAGLWGKELWQKYPRQMFRSRIVSEGVRTVYPIATSGMYVPEEAQDFGLHEPIDVTPPKEPANIEAQVDKWRAERDGKPEGTQFDDVGLDVDRLIAQGNKVVSLIAEDRLPAGALEQWWKNLSSDQRGVLGAKGRGIGPYLPSWKDGKQVAKQVQPPPTEAEQPADDGGSGEPASPPADASEANAETSFGLPPLPDAHLDDDEAACKAILAHVTACKTQETIAAVEFQWERRIAKLPEGKWRELMADIGKHKTALFEASAT